VKRNDGVRRFAPVRLLPEKKYKEQVNGCSEVKLEWK